MLVVWLCFGCVCGCVVLKLLELTNSLKQKTVTVSVFVLCCGRSCVLVL